MISEKPAQSPAATVPPWEPLHPPFSPARDAKPPLKLKSDEFRAKLLCDGIVFNPNGPSTAGWARCDIKPLTPGQPGVAALDFDRQEKGAPHAVPINRRSVADLLTAQLLKNGRSRYRDPQDTRVVFGSPVGDVAANRHVLKETAEACNLIFEHTHWQIRLLSKSSLLDKLVADNLVPSKYHLRLILGFSTGTVDDRIARAIEPGTTSVSQRLKSLHWLQDEGVRTFGMIRPSLPQTDYLRFSREICQAIRVDRCEHVWAEVIERHGRTLRRTIDGLRREGLNAEAQAVIEIGDFTWQKWEQYARDTFLAHAEHVSPSKLRFLQPIDRDSTAFWREQQAKGAVMLASAGKRRSISLTANSTAVRLEVVEPHLTSADLDYKNEREEIITTGVRASIAAAKALFEIHSYKNGILWRRDNPSFQAYCRAQWDYGKAHAYRLVECGDFILELEKKSPIGDYLPKTEGQIRPLLAFPKELRVDVWRAVTAKVGSVPLTGKMIAEKAFEHARTRHIELRPKPVTPPANPAEVLVALARLRTATAGHRHANRIMPLLQKIEALVS